MTDPTTASLVGLFTGLALAFAVIILPDIVSRWRYQRRIRAEQRERPDIPRGIERFVLRRHDGYWGATAYDNDGTAIETDTDTHPMDAVRNAIYRTQIRKEVPSR